MFVCDCIIPRYKSLVGVREPPAANGENCVIMLSKLCPLRPGAYHAGVTKVRFSSDLFMPLTLSQLKETQQYQLWWCWVMFMLGYTSNLFIVLFQIPCACERQLFLKEDIYQLLECKRERTRHLAALTLQRYTRMFFIRKRFVAFRKKIIGLQAQCRGFLTRSASLLQLVSWRHPRSKKKKAWFSWFNRQKIM